MRQLILQTDEQRNQYNEIYFRFTGRKVSEELLSHSFIRVFIDEHGDWISGYCVNSKWPLQYLACIEPSVLKERLGVLGVNEDDFVETAAMWRVKSKITLLRRVSIYWRCFTDAKNTGKKFFLAGTFEEKILSTHNLVCKKLLFEGVLNHRNHSQKGWIYYERTGLIHLRLIIAAVKEVLKRKKRPVCVRQ